MKQRFLTVLFATLVTLAFGACGAPSSDAADAASRAGGDGAGPAGDSGSDQRVAPAFRLPAIGGGEVALEDSAGRVRLVDFWATWCAPCREEIPFLNELQQTYGERGFEILAISSEDSGLVEEFVAEHGVEYKNLIGTEDLAQEYKVLGLPTGFLIDGEGHIVDVFFGVKPPKILRAKIEEMLAAS